MAFKKMKRPKYPPRLWSLVGYPGSGKSSFAAQMRGPMLVVDADHRFSEVLEIATGEVFELSDTPAHNVDPNAIARILGENMPKAEVSTIVVDSLTAIIMPLVVQAMLDNDAGRNRNHVAGFRNKALAMRQLQDAVTRWGADVLWIYHLQDSRDDKARAVTRATLTQTELARLTRSINMQLQLVEEGERRGVKVIWARRGRSDMVLWDEEGHWKGMPERIEEAVYGGLSMHERDQLERETPDYFPNPDAAVSWALEQGVFTSPEEGRAAYDSVKKAAKPKSAREMALLWVSEVQARATADAGAPEAEEPPREAPNFNPF